MIHARSVSLLTLVVCAAAALSAADALAQQPADELAPSKTLRTGHIGTLVPVQDVSMTAGQGARESFWYDLVPHFGPPTLAWVAVVVILVLTLQARPLFSMHNLDGIMLALVALLLPLRDNDSFIRGDQTGATVQWWVFLVLTLIGGYWLLRGLRLFFAKSVPALASNVSEGALVVVLAAGMFLAGSRIAQAPITTGSQDGLIGGICLAETGKLPYGESAEHDARSPLLYLLYGGAVQLVEPAYDVGTPMEWDQRHKWMHADVLNAPTFDDTVVRLVNAALVVLLLVALAGIGFRHHSLALGQSLVAIACIFPGALECLARPEIMLPTTLLAWSIALARVPGLGGFLSILFAIMAGVAWPWAWLAVPVLLAYFIRNGFQGLSAAVGLAGGVAAIVAGLLTLVAPSLPRQDGALKEAGLVPAYAARHSSDGALVIEHTATRQSPTSTFKSWLWKWMLARDETTLSDIRTQPALPNGIDAGAVMLRDIHATGAALQSLQAEYRASRRDLPAYDRAVAAARTVIESTWKPVQPPAPPRAGTWELWAAAADPQRAAHWSTIRRACKILVGLLVLLLSFAMLRGERPQPHHLLGGLLAVSAAVLVVSPTGAVANWVWLLPTALGALAVQKVAARPKNTPSIGQLPPLEPGPAPRITVEGGRN